MKIVEIDFGADGSFEVIWTQGAQAPKSRTFGSRSEAETFANAKAGKTGCVISSLDMSPEQRATHEPRK